jgi:aminoglycoside phosphotransferase (APT) family kinase protein
VKTTLGTTGDEYDPQSVARGDFSDKPRDLREEDAFDATAMHEWLRAQIPDLPAEPPHVRQFPGGASNLTYLLEYGARDLILRRPPTGTKAATAHDMRREFTVQQLLQPVFGLVPEVLALCTDQEVIGSDFYVMERVPGLILRGDLPDGFDLSAAQARDLSESMVDCLVALHGVDPEQAGLGGLGKGSGYVGRQVAGWSKRFRAAKTDNVPDFEAVMAWLAANQPQDVGTCVVHGDFRMDNLVLDPGDLTVRALLDWELATLGDPLMDLGCAMAYWVESGDDEGLQMARRQPSNAPGMLTRAEFVDRYTAASGLTPGNWTFYEVFGIFRLAVIAQQIYYRFHHGQTHNPAFQNFHAWVTYADRRCRQLAGLR